MGLVPDPLLRVHAHHQAALAVPGKDFRAAKIPGPGNITFIIAIAIAFFFIDSL